MKNVYMVQANAVYGEETKSTYIPYAAGCLAAYAWSDERVARSYRFCRFVYTRENIDAAIASFDEPFLVAFSCSVWNMNYNAEFAEKLKRKFPSCIVVFGGHQVSSDARTLVDVPAVDILIHNQGEEPFRELLVALDGSADLGNISNISYMNGSSAVSTPTETIPTQDYPSPYLEGWFDGILSDGYDFSAIIETNRGCPNRCAFCDWGQLKTKVHLFPMERVEAELRWLSEHKVSYVYCADANFGLFDRDVEITELLVRLKNETGYPGKLKVNFTKNRFDVVGKISRLLSENAMGKSQTLSFQSLDPQTLENIGRKNMSLDYFRRLIEIYSREGIPTYSELILGLPGETENGFVSGVCALLENGQHSSINIYPCELLPNSRMGSRDFMQKYGIRFVSLPFEQYHVVPSDEGIRETSHIVVQTDTLPRSGWIKAYVFSVFVQALHCMGLTRFIAVYARTELGKSYESFYRGLLHYAIFDDTGALHSAVSALSKHLGGAALGENCIAGTDSRFGAITYEPDELLFLRLAASADDFYRSIKRYCGLFCGKLTDELVSFQKSMIRLPGPISSIDMNHDFVSWFDAFAKGEKNRPEERSCRLCIGEARELSWADYAREVVWYGRRDGATLYTSPIYKSELKSI